MKVTQRDRQLLNLLFAQKVANVEQVNTLLMANISVSTTYRMLKDLLDEKFVQKVPYLLSPRSKCAYSITDKAFNEFILGNSEIKVPKRIKSNSIEHDITLVDLRIRFSKCASVVSWISENLLQCGLGYDKQYGVSQFVKHYPDAVMELKIEGQNYLIALEYEASIKNLARYEQKILNYYMHPEIGVVIYISANSSIQNLIKQSEIGRCANFQKKIYYNTIDNILRASGVLPFVNVENKSINIP